MSRSEYKARVVYGEVPTVGIVTVGNDRHPASAEVTIYWSADDLDITEEEAGEILSTFRLSECAQEGITEMYGLLFNTDFSS